MGLHPVSDSMSQEDERTDTPGATDTNTTSKAQALARSELEASLHKATRAAMFSVLASGDEEDASLTERYPRGASVIAIQNSFEARRAVAQRAVWEHSEDLVNGLLLHFDATLRKQAESEREVRKRSKHKVALEKEIALSNQRRAAQVTVSHLTVAKADEVARALVLQEQELRAEAAEEMRQVREESKQQMRDAARRAEVARQKAVREAADSMRAAGHAPRLK